MKKNLFTFPIDVLNSLKKFAIDRQKDIENKIRRIEKEDPFKDTDRLNDNLADEDVKEQIDHDRVLAIKKELTKNLEEIRIALKKIDSGKYGFCEKCGKLIDTARLEVYPFAQYCLACEKKNEK